MIFIRDGLKTLINRESESIDDIRVSQKYNSPKTTHFRFWEVFLGEIRVYTGYSSRRRVVRMRKKNFKGRCEKRMIGKYTEVCRTYDVIQYAYADLLQGSDEIKEIRCNVLLDLSLIHI